MTKVIGMLVALAMFCAMPAVAFAQDNNDSGNSNSGGDIGIDQGADASGGDGVGGSGGDGGSGDDSGSGGDGGDGVGGDGGTAVNSACAISQGANGDANASINCPVNVGGDTHVSGGGSGGDNDHVSVTRGHGGGVGGGSVHSVTLARTGFDAWILALVGGISLAGGLGLLAAQRRGRLNA